jgi:formylmethanofuran dehydrogenase subunit D
LKGLKKVSFGTSIIQKSRRVALDPNLLHTLELKEGDKVKVELDIDTATILIRKAATAAESKGGGSAQRSRA